MAQRGSWPSLEGSIVERRCDLCPSESAIGSERIGPGLRTLEIGFVFMRCRGAMGIAGGLLSVKPEPFCLFLASAEAF